MSLGQLATRATMELYAKFNGNSNDSSGNGRNGTDTSVTYSLANGKFGQGAGFAKASSSRSDFGNLFKLTAATAMTFSFWYKSTTSGVDDSIMGNYNAASGGGYSIEQKSDNKLHFETFNTVGASTGDAVSAQTINDGNWHSIVVIKNSTTGKVYVDARLGTNATIAPIDSGSGGTFKVGGDPNVYGYSDCSICELIIENREWSAAEITKYYTMVKKGLGFIAN